jgi:hypothetical protein
MNLVKDIKMLQKSEADSHIIYKQKLIILVTFEL